MRLPCCALLRLYYYCRVTMQRSAVPRSLAPIIYCADDIVDRSPRSAFPCNCYRCSSATALASPFCAVLLISITCLLTLTFRRCAQIGDVYGASMHYHACSMRLIFFITLTLQGRCTDDNGYGEFEGPSFSQQYCNHLAPFYTTLWIVIS